jgi:hypothetical protein
MSATVTCPLLTRESNNELDHRGHIQAYETEASGAYLWVKRASLCCQHASSLDCIHRLCNFGAQLTVLTHSYNVHMTRILLFLTLPPDNVISRHLSRNTFEHKPYTPLMIFPGNHSDNKPATEASSIYPKAVRRS